VAREDRENYKASSVGKTSENVRANASAKGLFGTFFSQGMGLGCFIVSSRDHSGRHLLMLSGARDMIPLKLSLA
jgi:hypothetical protein